MRIEASQLDEEDLAIESQCRLREIGLDDFGHLLELVSKTRIGKNGLQRRIDAQCLADDQGLLRNAAGCGYQGIPQVDRPQVVEGHSSRLLVRRGAEATEHQDLV